MGCIVRIHLQQWELQHQRILDEQLQWHQLRQQRIIRYWQSTDQRWEDECRWREPSYGRSSVPACLLSFQTDYELGENHYPQWISDRRIPDSQSIVYQNGSMGLYLCWTGQSRQHAATRPPFFRSGTCNQRSSLLLPGMGLLNPCLWRKWQKGRIPGAGRSRFQQSDRLRTGVRLRKHVRRNQQELQRVHSGTSVYQQYGRRYFPQARTPLLGSSGQHVRLGRNPCQRHDVQRIPERRTHCRR